MTLHDNQAAYWAGAANDVKYIAGTTGGSLYDQQLAGYNASVMPQQGGSRKRRGKNRRKTNRRKTNRRRYN